MGLAKKKIGIKKNAAVLCRSFSLSLFCFSFFFNEK